MEVHYGRQSHSSLASHKYALGSLASSRLALSRHALSSTTLRSGALRAELGKASASLKAVV